MNQILYTGGKNRKGGLNDTQKIVIFFVVFIIIFGICAIAIGANLINKVKNTEPTNTNPGTSGNAPVEADIKVEFESQVGGVKVIVTSSINIKDIKYWWNEEEATTLEIADKKYETVIPSRQGAHTLNIKVTDEEGNEKEATQLVIGDSGPEVTILTDGVSNYVITAKDDEKLTKLVIVLNGETQEIEVNDKEIEYKVAIPQGDSIIKVTAYNLNELTTTKKAKITNFGG